MYSNLKKAARFSFTCILIGLLCSAVGCQSAISKEDPQTLDAFLPLKSEDQPLAGTFCRGAFEVELDASGSVGIFTKVGKGHRHVGDTLLSVSKRTGAASWRGTAFDSSFQRQGDAEFAIQGDVLTVSVSRQGAYQWTLKQPPVMNSVAEERVYTAPRGRRSGTGCGVVQCGGTTKAGRQCRRTTSNCSGRCWQHE